MSHWIKMCSWTWSPLTNSKYSTKSLAAFANMQTHSPSNPIHTHLWVLLCVWFIYFVFFNLSSLLNFCLWSWGPSCFPVLSSEIQVSFDQSRVSLCTTVASHIWMPEDCSNFSFLTWSCLSRSKALGKEALSHAGCLLVIVLCVILSEQVFYATAVNVLFFI